MARSLSDEELQNVVDTNSSRKRQNANKKASLAEDSGDHSTDPLVEKGKEIIDLVSRQNIDVEGEISVNIDGEVVKSEFAHIVEGIPTEKNEDKTDVETGHTRPVEKLICNDTESGVKVNDNKEEDPSLNNEEYGGDKRAGLASFEHMDSEDHSEGIQSQNEVRSESYTLGTLPMDMGSPASTVSANIPCQPGISITSATEEIDFFIDHQLVDDVECYSLSRNCILWMHFHLEVNSHLLNGQFMTTTRLWVLMIGIEEGSFFKYMIVLDVSTCSASSRGTIFELNPDVPCELMPNFQQRELKRHSFQEAVTQNSGILDGSAVSDSQRREVPQGWKDYIRSVIEPAIDGKIYIRKCYLDIFQYHSFQIMEFIVGAVPWYNVIIPVQESSNQPLSDTIYPAASEVSDLRNSATADQVSDEEVRIDDHVTRGSGTDADAAILVGYMTDPQILDQSTFEMSVSRLEACRPFAVIAQETDQQASCMSQYESTRELYTREIDNLPAPALPAIISSRSSEGSSQTTGSKFAPRPSADLRRQGDSSQTTDLCPNRSTDHHSSACLQKYNDTKKEVAPSETGLASVDDWRSLWDAPRTPGIFNIKETDHCTKKDVAALKESIAVEPTKNQQKISANTGTKKEPSPNNPDYTEKTTRIASFRKWSPELQQPEEMADCGFYHTGYQDLVRCFSCGHFKNWVPNRNPWIEHARLFPNCAYILQMKGVEFVNYVRMMTEESNENLDDHTAHHGVPLGGAESSNTIENSGAEEGASGEDSQIELEKTLRENRRLLDAERCISCKTEPKCAVFLPCGHRLFCTECATSFKKCPACKKCIETFVLASFS